MQDDFHIFGNGKSSKTTKKNQHHKFPSGLGYPKPERKDEGKSYTLFLDITILDLIFYFTTNIRTLELTHVLGTVSSGLYPITSTNASSRKSSMPRLSSMSPRYLPKPKPTSLSLSLQSSQTKMAPIISPRPSKPTISGLGKRC